MNNPSNSPSIDLVFHSQEEIVPEFQKAMLLLAQKGQVNFFTGQFYHDMQTAFVEGAANAIRHGHELDKYGKVVARLKIIDGTIQMEIDDHGKGYVLEEIPMPQFELMTESGRGIFMMRQLMDEVEYRCSSDINTLIMRRQLVGQDPETRALDLLYEISGAMLSSSDVQTIYNIILDKALQVFQVERASILVFDKDQKKLKVVASRGINQELRSKIEIRPGEGVAGYVYQHSKPCLIEDMNANHAGWEAQKQYKSRSFISAPMICSPMTLGQESIGVINMTDRADGRPFTKKDLKLLTTIANQASAYLHTVKLLSEAKEAEFYRKELDIARRIQESYLPSRPPVWKGYDIGGWCQMAQSVGGDYYDYLEEGADKYVVIADVSGHNVAAALTMASLRSQLRGLIHSLHDPGKILTRLNELLFQELSQNDQFISIVLAHLSANRVLKIANAGHGDPCLLSKKGNIELVGEEVRGTVMGVFPKESYKSCTVKMTRGSLLFFYTDGLLECRNKEGKYFGLKHLNPFLKAQTGKKSGLFLKDLSAKFVRFTKGTVVSDDATAVVIGCL